MGMFDDVDFKMDCPNCGHLMDNFQSKDGPCLLGVVKPIDVHQFYAACNKCEAWIEFNRRKPESLNDFDMTCTPKKAKTEK